MEFDLTEGGRGNPRMEPQVGPTKAVNSELKADTTAVITLFMQPEHAESVDDIWQLTQDYLDQTLECRASKKCTLLAADFRKVFWCTALGEWKIINFYFNTSWMDAAKHANNRELLEAYLGKDYRCDGATVGRIWSEQQSVLAGCIKLCDVSLDAGIKKYEENITKIAKLVASQLH